jgi:hypothetical protein
VNSAATDRLPTFIISTWKTLDNHTPPRKSVTFDDALIAEIRRAATIGIYDIRGGGTKCKLPHFDDLLFLGASISRRRHTSAFALPVPSRGAAKPLSNIHRQLGLPRPL